MTVAKRKIVLSRSDRFFLKNHKRAIVRLCLALFLGPFATHFACAENVTYIYTDPQGTPLVEADANGNVLRTFDYRPYGVLTLGAPGTGPSYTGHISDADTSLIYMQARYYDPVAGRFLSTDLEPPTDGDLFSHNRYAYANNAPLSHTDPSGRCIEDACIGEGIVLYEGIEALIGLFEAGDTVVAATTTAEATTATAATSATLGNVAAQCAANTVCTGAVVTSVVTTTEAVRLIQQQQTPITVSSEEHTKNARPSTKGKHEKGNSRRKQDAGNEKGDKNRRPPSKRPPGTKGPWPPKGSQSGASDEDDSHDSDKQGSESDQGNQGQHEHSEDFQK